MTEPTDSISATPNFGDVVSFNCVLLPIVIGIMLLHPLSIFIFAFFSIFVLLPPSTIVFLFARRWQGRARVTLVSSLGGWVIACALLTFFGYLVSSSFFHNLLISLLVTIPPYIVSMLIYLILCRAMCAHERKQQQQAAAPPAHAEDPPARAEE